MRALCINCGSSSLKLAVYELGDEERRLAEASVEGDDLARALSSLDARAVDSLDAIGHRVVHGGIDLAEPVRIDDGVIAKLRAAIPFAPLHLPAALAAIDAARARFPDVPQVACFDTGFHRDLPDVARRLPLPRALAERGVRRYGFHGLSFEYVVSALGEAAKGRLVIAHLGNGASLAAVRDGRSIDTTMGLTPTGGVMMGTRTGDLDPGVLVYLLRAGWGMDAIERLVDREAGLLGVSGSTSDMRALLAKRSSDADADLAVRMFCLSVRKAIGAMAAALGGIDRLVFTGGIGEHAADVRAEITAGLAHLGVGSTCDVRVVATNEDLVIARHTRALVQKGESP